jgi:hypothetical protein
MASSVNFGTQQYFGFDPRTIPGCCLWMDAADARTLTTSGGGNVTQWADKSGLGATMTPFGANSNATIQTNYRNGLSALNFSGLNQYQSPSGTGVYPSDVYILVALKTLTRMDVISIGPTSTDNFNSLTFGEHTALRWHNGSSSFARTPNTVSPTNETSTSLLLMNWSLADNNFVIRRNGTQLSSTASYTYTPTAGAVIQIGFRHQNFGTNLSFDAYVGEVLTFNRQLGDSERQQVEGYLAWKWALTSNLPSTHPFRPAPPIMRGFLPVDVSGALLWLDAADATTITGSPVTQWTDKSGRGSNATTGLGSVVAGTAINSSNTLRFGLSTTLNLSNFVMPSAQTSVFYVLRGITTNPNSAANTGYFVFSRTADNFSVFSGNQQFFSYQNPGLSRAYNGVMGPPGERTWSNTPTAAFFNTTSVVSTTGVSYSSVNGVPWTLFATCNVSNTAFTATTYQISTSRSCCGDVYTYDLGELVVCDGTVSTLDAQRMEGYLAWKWGLGSSLPTTHPYYRVLPSTPVFNPAQLPTLSLWMDPTDSTTLTLSGSSVTQWRDKSATGAVFSTVNANPTYTASLINGLPGLDLTNASGFISVATQNLAANLTLAMILVVKSGIGGWGSFFTHGSRDLDIALERNSISTGTTLQFQSGNDNAGANITFTTDQVALYIGTMTTATSRVLSRFGGGTTTTASGTNTSTISLGLQTIRIGRSDTGENCNSFIGEIVYYQRALTTIERQELEGYLAWKWGLQTSLPSTHPFAKFRP